MKKIILLTLLFALVATIAFAATFSDLNSNYPSYEKAISALNEKGIISGYPDGTFKPSNTVKRSEVAKILVTAFDLKKNASIEVPEDVKDSWAKDYVEIAMSNEVIKGYDDGTFKPENPVTYGELAALVSRLLKLETTKEEGEAWYNEYWRALTDAELFKDIATNDVIAINNARRDNVALIIYNALSYSPEKKEEPKEEEKTETEKTQSGEKEVVVAEIDTTKIYFGIVDTKQLVRGRDTVEINNFNAETMTINVKNTNPKPEDGSVLFYKIRKSLSITHLKEAKISDLANAYVVEEIDDEEELAKIKGQAEYLDIQDDDYTFGGTLVKFARQNYFELRVKNDKKQGWIFTSGTELKREDVELQEDDRIIVEPQQKLFIIVRGYK